MYNFYMWTSSLCQQIQTDELATRHSQHIYVAKQPAHAYTAELATQYQLSQNGHVDKQKYMSCTAYLAHTLAAAGRRLVMNSASSKSDKLPLAGTGQEHQVQST